MKASILPLQGRSESIVRRNSIYVHGVIRLTASSLPGWDRSRSIRSASAPAPGKPAGRAPGLATDISAPGYFRMLTARATTSATVTMEMTDCRAMASFAQRDSGRTSVGLNADALVKAR
jgi:hypothetical protein